MKLIQRFLKFPVPLYFYFLSTVILVVSTAGIVYKYYTKNPVVNENVNGSPPPQRVVMLRSNYYKLIKPIILSDLAFEAYSLAPVKQKVNAALDNYKRLGLINSASLVLKELETGDWFGINANEKYNPGSLVKVAVMITYLKDSESQKGLLDKKIFFKPEKKGIPHQTYEVNPLVRGNAYTIRELLKRMATDSDNNSTALLNDNINLQLFKQIYSDLDQEVPNVSDINYQTNVVDYSKFMTVLFDGSYLNRENSEMALEWLSESSFQEGITRFLPGNILVAHKFGEFGLHAEKQWHETAIIYVANRPYLLTIMTKGNEIEKLREVISDVSKQIFDLMKTN